MELADVVGYRLPIMRSQVRDDEGHEFPGLASHGQPGRELPIEIFRALASQTGEIRSNSSSGRPMTGDAGRQPVLGIPLSVNPPPDIQSCGVARSTHSGRKRRVVGGKVVEITYSKRGHNR